MRGLQRALLVSVVLLLLGNLLRVQGRDDPLLDEWLLHVPIAISALLIGLRPLLRRGDRAAWSLLALGVGSWLVGDLWWQAAYGPSGENAPSPNITDAWYLLLYPCAAAALLLLATRQAAGMTPGLALDGLVAGLGAAAVGALLFNRIRQPGGSGMEVLVDLAYPVADLVLLAVALAVLVAQGWRLTWIWWALAAGCLLLVVADTHFLLKVAADDYRQGTPYDLGWPLGFTLMGLAAWAPSTSVRRAGHDQPALVVPILVTAISVGVLVAAAERDIPQLAVALAAAALLGAAARTGLALRELRLLVEQRRLAMTDDLTGLGNRRLLQDRLTALLAARRPGSALAVLLLDLDRFKEVNDALGHHVGDELLRRIGPRLAGVLREGDLLARLGGDEFALLLGPGADAAHATAVAARVREALRAPFALEGVELHVEVSIGIALCPDHATTASGLLQCADVAMYDAKHSRSGSAVYSPDRDRHDLGRLQLIAQLHAALAGDEVVCHYQPQCDLATGQIVAVEALVRWEHPDRGLLKPEAFLGLAGQVGLMATLTRRVLSLALEDCAEWRRSGVDLGVSVNLSGMSLSDHGLPTELARLLRRTGLPAEALVLEVTEDVMLSDASSTGAVVEQLQTLGVRLSIDDYGTGYSSLTRLRTLPVHELKLDRSYIAGLGSDDRDAAIVDSTVALAHALGLVVVAEGVETADDWQELTRLSCDRAQGHLLSPPLAPPQLRGWLEARTAAAGAPG